MRTSTTFLILFLFISTNINAQDPIFSQFNFNKLYLNPAFAGHNGGLSISMNNHNHLVDVPGDFRTYSVSADLQVPCNRLGIGIIGLNHLEGEVPLLTNSFGAMGSYIRQINESNTRNTHAISLGGAFRYVQTRLDMSRAIFSSQLDHVDGVLNQAPNTTIANEMIDYLDFDFGAVYVLNKYNNSNHTISLSTSHWGDFTNPDESLQNRSVRRPFKLTAYYAWYKPYNLSRYKVGVSPHFLFERQNKLNHFLLGAYLFGNVYDKKFVGNGFYTGIFYQNTPYPNFQDANTFIMTIGLGGINIPNTNEGRLGFGYSIDIPNRGLKLGTSHEFSVRFHFQNANPFCPSSSQNLLNCNKFIQ